MLMPSEVGNIYEKNAGTIKPRTPELHLIKNRNFVLGDIPRIAAVILRGSLSFTKARVNVITVIPELGTKFRFHFFTFKMKLFAAPLSELCVQSLLVKISR